MQVRQPAPHLAERRNRGDRWFPDECVRPRERWSGIGEIPESGCDFVPEDIGGELLMPQDCPGFSTRSKAPLGGKIECGMQKIETSPGDTEKMGESDQSSVITEAFPAWPRPAAPPRSELRLAP